MQKKQIPWNYIAGGCLALSLVSNIINSNIINMVRHSLYFHDVLYFILEIAYYIGIALLIFSAFAKKPRYYPFVGFTVLTAMSIYSVFSCWDFYQIWNFVFAIVLFLTYSLSAVATGLYSFARGGCQLPKKSHLKLWVIPPTVCAVVYLARRFWYGSFSIQNFLLYVLPVLAYYAGIGFFFLWLAHVEQPVTPYGATYDYMSPYGAATNRKKTPSKRSGAVPQYMPPAPPQYMPPAPQQYMPPAPQMNMVNELEQYQQLAAKGMITPEEYEALRRKVLGL